MSGDWTGLLDDSSSIYVASEQRVVRGMSIYIFIFYFEE